MSAPSLDAVTAYLATGIAVIDEEHQHLLGYVADLDRLCTKYCTKQPCDGCVGEDIDQYEAELIGLYERLLDYMAEHFKNEEALLKLLGLSSPQWKQSLRAHFEEHARLSNRLLALILDRDHSNPANQFADAASLLRTWLHDHITEFDIPMFRHAQTSH